MQKMANFSGKYNFWLANYVRYLKCYGTVVLRLPVSVYKDVKLKYLGSLVDEPFENMSNSLLESILADYEDITFRNSSDEPWRQLLGTIYGAMNSLARSDDDYAVTFTSPQTQFFCNSGLFVGVAVHSNCGPVSGRGVVYSRNPCTGIKQLSGEYYDCSMTVDSEYCRGIEAPSSMNDLFNRNIQLYSQCQRACDALEGKYRDAQTVEFEVENRRIFIVKSWASSRSPEASVVIVLDLVLEGLITIQEALVRIQPSDVDWISSRYLICLSPVPDSKMQIYNCHVSDSILTLGSGIAVSCGSIVGSLVLCGRAPPNSDGVYILLLDNWNCDMSSTLVLSASGYLCLGGGDIYADAVASIILMQFDTSHI